MSLKSLQTKIGVTADGAFGPGTLKAGMAFYKFTPERAAPQRGSTGAQGQYSKNGGGARPGASSSGQHLSPLPERPVSHRSGGI